MKKILVLLSLGATLVLFSCGKKEQRKFDLGDDRGFVLLDAPARDACEVGIKAFGGTVHKLLRQDCTQCHDSGGMGPAHSISDVAKSYSRILAYVDWTDMNNSRLVK